MNVTVEVKGWDRLTAQMSRLTFALADERRFLKEVQGIIRASTHKKFVEGQGKWPPLSPAYARALARKGRNPKPTLNRTGRLMRPLTSEAPPILTMTPTALTFGTNVPYARPLQEGWWGTVRAHSRRVTTVGRYKGKRRGLATTIAKTGQVRSHERLLPSRPFLYFDDKDRAEIAGAAQRYVMKALTGGGNG